jgi:glutaredoxin 2
MRSLFGRARPTLRLYNLEYCYYCVLVRREANRLGLDLKLIDVHNDTGGRQRLREATGRTRVPVLGIHRDDGGEEFLPESQDIIRYLRSLVETRPRPAE